MTVVLADTSVWVAHFRRADPVLQSLVALDRVLCHPLVVLELACGTPPAPRERTIGDLKKLQQAVVATTDETLALIEREKFHNSGCGAIDMALIASVLLNPDTLLWTLDKNSAPWRRAWALPSAPPDTSRNSELGRRKRPVRPVGRVRAFANRSCKAPNADDHPAAG